MLANIPLRSILFIDIETVPQQEFWIDVDEKTQSLYDKKTIFQRKAEQSSEEFYYERAGILAEFGKIVCISCGIVSDLGKIKITSFASSNEYKLLTDFNELLRSEYFNGNVIINQIELPNPLKLFGKKPWEILHLDTLELWKFGDYKNFTSLDLLAHILGIESPKNDIDGSQVAYVYYKEKKLERIKKYCEKDVETLIKVFLKLQSYG